MGHCLQGQRRHVDGIEHRLNRIGIFAELANGRRLTGGEAVPRQVEGNDVALALQGMTYEVAIQAHMVQKAVYQQQGVPGVRLFPALSGEFVATGGDPAHAVAVSRGRCAEVETVVREVLIQAGKVAGPAETGQRVAQCLQACSAGSHYAAGGDSVYEPSWPAS